MNLSNITVQNRLETLSTFFKNYKDVLPFDIVGADEGSIAIESLFWLKPEINLALFVMYAKPREYTWLKNSKMINSSLFMP